MKADGDSFKPDEALCTMVVGGITLEFESDRAGVILEKLVNEGQIVPVGQPILNCAVSKEIYLEYIDSKRIEAVEHGNPEAEDVKSEGRETQEKEKEKKPDKLVLMREIKHLIQENHLDEESGKLMIFFVVYSFLLLKCFQNRICEKIAVTGEERRRSTNVGFPGFFRRSCFQQRIVRYQILFR
jgi:hypothetical protein